MRISDWSSDVCSSDLVRATNDFGRLGYRHEDGAAETPIEETLDALDAVVQAGKVRHVGLSNENPWGVMRFLALAGQGRGPRVVSVQNPYRSEEHTSELQSLMRISYAGF